MAQAVELSSLRTRFSVTVGPIEIRQYGPRLAAETDMGPGMGIEAEQEATFMALAAFIFGQNRQGPEVAMTAPVSVEQVTAPIAMTAPVAMEPGEGAGSCASSCRPSTPWRRCHDRATPESAS